MKKLSKREIVLIVSSLIIASIALFVIYYYIPQKDRITQLKQESLQLSLDIDERKTMKLLVDAEKNEVIDYKQQIADADEYLMDSIDEPNILYYISNNIYNTSEKQSVSYSVVEDREVYVNKDILLSFDTSFENLITILGSFEEGDIYTTLNSINIKMDRSNYNTYDGFDDEEQDDEEDKENKSPLNVSYDIRFYATDATWDGSGEYEFMENGKFKRANIFE